MSGKIGTKRAPRRPSRLDKSRIARRNPGREAARGASPNSIVNGHGAFSSDNPETLWLTEAGSPDRDMKLLREFSFTDPDGKIWLAPKDCRIDGASIPKALWSLVGSPYTGFYRRASIVHDKACDDAGSNSSARRAADRMFFHACRAGGSSPKEATILYLGVRVGALAHHVDDWSVAVGEPMTTLPRTMRMASEERLESNFQRAAEQVLAAGIVDDPVEIERRADEALTSVTGVNLRGR